MYLFQDTRTSRFHMLETDLTVSSLFSQEIEVDYALLKIVHFISVNNFSNVIIFLVNELHINIFNCQTRKIKSCFIYIMELKLSLF